MLHFWGIIASSAVQWSPVAAGGKQKKHNKTKIINIFLFTSPKYKKQYIFQYHKCVTVCYNKKGQQ